MPRCEMPFCTKSLCSVKAAKAALSTDPSLESVVPGLSGHRLRGCGTA